MLDHSAHEVRTRRHCLLQSQRHSGSERLWDPSLCKEPRRTCNGLLSCTPLLRWEAAGLQWCPSLTKLLFKFCLGIRHNLGQRLHLLHLLPSHLQGLLFCGDCLLRTFHVGCSSGLGFALRFLIALGRCQLLRRLLFFPHERRHSGLRTLDGNAVVLQRLRGQARHVIDHRRLEGVARLRPCAQCMRRRCAEHNGACWGQVVSEEVQQIESGAAPLHVLLWRLARRHLRRRRCCRSLNGLWGLGLCGALRGRGSGALDSRGGLGHLLTV
mmetsp:Transcript_30856/g.77997  ORF Transcript_30856/g.77997 Transcript_30856/m.77997 type:complete len:269 (-) Transcript_30856:99-905(-)